MKPKDFLQKIFSLQNIFNVSAGFASRLEARGHENVGMAFDHLDKACEQFGELHGVKMADEMVTAGVAGFAACGDMLLRVPFVLACGATKLITKGTGRPLNTQNFSKLKQ